MPERERHAIDVVADDLILVYTRGARRLQVLVADALRRGVDPTRAGTPTARPGDATAAYRERNRRMALAIVAELQAHGRRAAPRLTEAAYGSALGAVDKVLGPESSARGTFGGIHQGTVHVLAGNLNRSLDAAATNLGTNVEAVFARAALLDGAIPPNGINGLGFVGRRVDDVWRQLALETIAEGQVALRTRRQVSRALAERLVAEGVTDATTGFVDKAGRRWDLGTYTETVARTTTREAASRATVARMREHDEDLVQISSHEHKHDVCSPFDGETFSMSGTDARYPRLVKLPPFHVRCRHVVGPADVSLDDFERELEREARARARAIR